MSYEIDEENRLVRIVGTGLLTDDEMVKCIVSLRTDPKLEPEMNTLSDMRDIEVGFTKEGVEQMVAVMKGTSDRRRAAKAAIVVRSDVAYGMARMFEMISEGRAHHPSFRVFRDLVSALEWLKND